MAKLIYVTNVSLDGYIEDEHGSFDWTPPDDEYFAFITDLVRPMGTYLYGRRLYESMAALGDRSCPGRTFEAHGRLRRRLAGSGQGRLLHDAGRDVDRQDPARTELRPRLGTRHEGLGHQ